MNDCLKGANEGLQVKSWELGTLSKVLMHDCRAVALSLGSFRVCAERGLSCT